MTNPMNDKASAILKFLQNGDEFGELAIVEAVKGVDTVPTPAVLAALEARGLITLHRHDHSRFYSITDKGAERAKMVA